MNRKRSLMTAAAVIGGIALASLFDRTLNKRAKKWNSRWVRRASTVGHLYQTPLVILGAAGGISAYGALADKSRLQHIGKEILEAYAAAFIGSESVKHLLGRSRPYQNRGPFHFDGLALRIRNTSFPSGDVAAAFSMSTVLAAETRSVPAAAVFYGLATLTAFQRISTNQHWLSDTVAGAVLGAAAGLAVVHHHQTKE
jgi:membrane-associated phospholipid phosphatase